MTAQWGIARSLLPLHAITPARPARDGSRGSVQRATAAALALGRWGACAGKGCVPLRSVRGASPPAQMFRERLRLLDTYEQGGFYSYHVAEHRVRVIQ